jgi:hypothetical protein
VHERNVTEKRLVLLRINSLARAPEMSYFADGQRGGAMISALERFEQDGARQNVPADLQMIGNIDQALMAALS